MVHQLFSQELLVSDDEYNLLVGLINELVGSMCDCLAPREPPDLVNLRIFVDLCLVKCLNRVAENLYSRFEVVPKRFSGFFEGNSPKSLRAGVLNFDQSLCF